MQQDGARVNDFFVPSTDPFGARRITDPLRGRRLRDFGRRNQAGVGAREGTEEQVADLAVGGSDAIRDQRDERLGVALPELGLQAGQGGGSEDLGGSRARVVAEVQAAVPLDGFAGPDPNRQVLLQDRPKPSAAPDGDDAQGEQAHRGGPAPPLGQHQDGLTVATRFPGRCPRRFPLSGQPDQLPVSPE